MTVYYYKSLLQNVTEGYYKMRRVFYYKKQQFSYKMQQLLQNVTILLQNAIITTKCDFYYKLQQCHEETVKKLHMVKLFNFFPSIFSFFSLCFVLCIFLLGFVCLFVLSCV